jgi:hypothetical protein
MMYVSANEKAVSLNLHRYSEVPLGSFGPHAAHFLTEGCTVQMLFYGGEEISAALPDEVEMGVTEAAPAMKGESVSSQFKPATLDSGQGGARWNSVDPYLESDCGFKPFPLNTNPGFLPLAKVATQASPLFSYIPGRGGLVLAVASAQPGRMKRWGVHFRRG